MDYFEKISDNTIGKFIFIIAILGLCLTTYIALTNLGIWTDELYSIFTTKYPYDYFVETIIGDVHPPLYYYILLFLNYVFKGVNPIIIGHIASIIPLYLLFVIGYFTVRKRFGWLTFGLFSFFITFMPRFMFNYIEIRMYSWAMFFLTASFIYLIEVVNLPNYKNWILFTLFTIGSAYTHYYSAIGSVILYLGFLIYILFKNRQLLKGFICSALIAIVSYIPWIPTILNQLNRHVNYWILPITPKTIVSYFFFIFSPNEYYIVGNDLIPPTILGCLLIIALAILIIYSLKKRNESENKYAYAAILVAIMIPLVGILISIIRQPLFHYRYIFPGMGCFWLGIAMLLNKIENKRKIFTLFLIIFLIIGFIGAYNFVDTEQNSEKSTKALNQTLDEKFEPNSAVIYSRNMFIKMAEFTPDEVNILWMKENTSSDFKIEDRNVFYEIDAPPTSNISTIIKEKFNVTHVYYVTDDGIWLKDHNISAKLINDYEIDPYGLLLDIPGIFELT